jgi:hypothetical protein
MSRTAKRIGRDKAIAKARRDAALVQKQREMLNGMWSLLSPMLERRADVSFSRTGTTASGTARVIDRRPDYQNATDSPLRNVSHGTDDALSLLSQALPIEDWMNPFPEKNA